MGVALVVWSLILVRVSTALVTWQSDSIAISIETSSNTFTLDLQASRYVLPATTGHFKFTVTRDGVGLNTSCISYGATAAAVADALDALDYVDDLGGSTVVREGDGSSQYNYGFVYYMSASNASESLAGSVNMEIIGSGVDHGCARVSTLGFWDEPDNWDTGVAPTSTDEVSIPVDAGFVSLTDDTTIVSLQMNGGALVTHDSTCLSGWTPAPGGASASFGNRKCYRVFGNAASWSKAQSTCAAAVGPRNAGFHGGALRGALASVEGLDENQWVARLCRGDSMDRDCWVGMTRSYKGGGGLEVGSGGDLEWAEARMMAGDTRYRSWAIREPSGFEGDQGGENCVAIHGTRRLAADQGEARWYDTECEAEKPFVCQAFGVSTPFTLTVSTNLDIGGGYILGAGTVISSSSAQVSGDEGEVGLLNGATLLNAATGAMTWSAPSAVGWGGTLRNMGTLTFTGTLSLAAAADVAGFLDSHLGAWPLVVNEGGAEVVCEADSEVAMEWLLWNQGGEMLVEGELAVIGGGYSSGGDFTVQAGGKASFSNSSFAMDQSEVILVTLQAGREVSGLDVESSAGVGGYYRLAFGGEETECIGYHASADSVQDILEELPSVEGQGGVTVRRDGNGKMEHWQYGYRYVVTFDGARNLSESNSLTLSCSGSAGGCGCVDIVGAIAGPGDTRVGCGSAIFGAENASTSAEFDPSECRVQATVELQTLREGGETTLQGGGGLAFSDGGQYFLPSVVSANVEVMSGAEVVCPQWAAELVGAVNVTSGGVLWFAGADGDALDAVHLLHKEPRTPGRAGDAIASPPYFNATVFGDVSLQSEGEVRLAAASPAALTVIGSLTLVGGGLSGQGHVVVQGPTVLLANGSFDSEPSSLKNGVTLEMHGGGAWSGGDLQAQDGATVVNEGLFEVFAEDGATFGAGGDFGATSRLDFDGVEWYVDPLCGPSCTVDPSWENAVGGEVVGGAGSDASLCFALLNEAFHDNDRGAYHVWVENSLTRNGVITGCQLKEGWGTVRVEDGGRLEWCGEGVGGGNGTVLLPGLNSTLVFSKGNFVLGTRANASGEGVLEFSGGTGHELLSGAVYPLVRVSGHGTATFVGTNLTLGRGVAVTDTAKLVFSASTSYTSIAGDLTLEGDGLIAFPSPTVEASLLSTSTLLSSTGTLFSTSTVEEEVENPWRSEGEAVGGWGGWGASSRSTVRVAGNVTWTGGTMYGNARVLCVGESDWSGGPDPKKLLASLHLVNTGDVVWSTGDVLVSQGASFVNHGTLRLQEPVNGFDEFAPRIRAPRKGEEGWDDNGKDADGSSAVFAGGAGYAGGGAANWA